MLVLFYSTWPMFGTASCREWLCQHFIEIFGERKKSVGMTTAASKFEWFSRHGNWHVSSAPCAWHSLYLLLLVFHHPSLFHSRLKTFLFSWFVPPYTGSLHFFFWIDYMNYSSDLEVSDTCVRSSLLSWVELSSTGFSWIVIPESDNKGLKRISVILML